MPEAEVTHFGIVTFCFNNILSNNKLLSTLFYQGEVSLLFLNIYFFLSLMFLID